jgi:BirA family transcriptional regulator, biotin operon repressor / biotin---[acetyl-CoA-carboxylase] ligase
MLTTEPLPAALADAVEAARPRFCGHVADVAYAASVPSTMDWAAALADAGGPHGLVVVAGHQTAGRGRRGRRWHSPAHAGLYFSTVVRPPAETVADGEPSVFGLLTLAAGVAVAEGIGQATGLEASLKWPNDLFYGHKLAGVLAEGHGLGQPTQFVVIGVGINVRDVKYLADSEGRSASLERELGHVPDAGRLAAEVLAAWAQRYQDLLERRFTRVVDRWRVRASGLIGRPVAWADAAGGHEGTTTGVDPTGALLVDTGERVVRITSGPVQWQ